MNVWMDRQTDRLISIGHLLRDLIKGLLIFYADHKYHVMYRTETVMK